METIVIVGHVLAAIAIIGLILLQQGKGADMGASFGAGASQTLFGSQGSGNFFSRATALIAVIFFATSVTLAVIAKEKTTVGEDFDIPTMEERDVPTVDEPVQPQGDVPAVETPGPSAAEVPTVEETGEQNAPEAADGTAETEANATEVPQPEQ